MLGEADTEQFVITTRVDGQLIKEQKIHDPFLHNRTTVRISRWDLFKALFRRQFEISVRGTEGITRAIMTLDPIELAKETASILESRRLSCETNSASDSCYIASN